MSLVQEVCVGDHRILALVECNSSFALFIIISEHPQPKSFSDLTIERAIPIDQYFSCGKLRIVFLNSPNTLKTV